MQDFGGVPGGDYCGMATGRFSTDRFGGGGLGREDLGRGGLGPGNTVPADTVPANTGPSNTVPANTMPSTIARAGMGSGPEGAAGGFGQGPGAGIGRLMMAEALGLAMARRAADILDRHRDVLTRAPVDHDGPDARQFAMDDAVFTAVLDAANECLGWFDSRPPADRWCDALLYLLDLARYDADSR